MSNNLQIRILTELRDKLSAPLAQLQSRAGAANKAFGELSKELNSLNRQNKTIEQFKTLEDRLKNTGSQLNTAKERLSSLEQQFSSTTNPTQRLTQQLETARNRVERLTAAHDKQNNNLSELKSKLDSSGISTQNLAQHEQNLAGRIKETTSALNTQKAALEKAAEVQNRLAENKSRLQNTQQMAASMAITGAAGVATGRKVLGGMASVMAPGIQFDQSMSNVAALTRLDKNAEEFKLLEAQAQKLGAATMFTATQAADAQGFLAMAGFTPDAIKGAMPGMLDLAKAGGLDLARAADVSSNILSGMNIAPEEMGRVGDVLVGAFTRSNTTLDMLGETMKYAAPIAASLNIDIETLAAATGKLGDAGIQGGKAGTALRSILNRLSAPPKMAADALHNLGIKTKDASGNLLALPDILVDIEKKTRGMGTAVRAEMLKAIAGEEAVSAMNILVDKAGTGDLQEMVETLRNSGGEAAEVALKQSDNLIGDIDKLKSAWEDIGITLFKTQDGALRGIVQRGTEIVQVIGEWTKENPELTAQLVKLIGLGAAIITGFGGLAITLASIIGPFALIRYALTSFVIKAGAGIGLIGKLAGVINIARIAVLTLGRALLLNPIGLFITTAYAAVFAIKNWDKIKEYLSDFWSWLSNGFNNIWPNIKKYIANAWTDINNEFINNIGQITKILLDWSPLGAIYSVFATVFNYLGITVPSQLSTAVFDIYSALTEVFSAGWQRIKNIFVDSIDGITGTLINWSPVGIFYKAFSAVLNYLGITVPSQLSTAVFGIYDSVKTRLSELFSISNFLTYGKNIVTGITSGISGAIGGAMNAVGNLGSRVADKFKSTLGIRSPSRIMAGLAQWIPAGVASGITGNQQTAITAAQALASRVANASTYMIGGMEPVRIDRRAPIGQRYNSTLGAANNATYNITINATGTDGASANNIAQMVRYEIERINRQEAARNRSRYLDYGN